MKGKHCLFLLLILGALLACNDPKPVTDALHRAEALMNEHPDSAWAVLNTLSPDEMGQNRTRALYALLYTQAQDKTYRDETNDSLISIAVDYYRHTDDARRKFLSYYYKGRVHFNAKDYQNATLCYMEAEQLADEVGDDYLVGLLYSELGRIYRLYYDYPKSLEAYQKAADCYGRAGKIRHRNYMWLNQSDVCRNMEQYDESERLLQMTLESAKKEHDSSLTKLCLASLMMQYVEQRQIPMAKELYQELELLVDDNYGSASYMGALVRMYMSEQNFFLVKQCLDKGWKRAVTCTDSINLYLTSSDVLFASGDERTAYQELLKGVLMQNKETRQALQQPVLTAQRDYLSEKLEFEAYKLRMEKRLRLLYILLFSLVIVMVVYVLSRKLKKEKEKARKTIDELNCEILHRDRESRHKIASLLEELEEQDKSASASIQGLRSELQRQEEDYHRYIKEAEEMQKNLNTKFMQHSERSADFFRRTNSIMSELYLVFREKKVSALGIGRVVHKWEDEYWIGKKALIRLEELLDFYYNDVMYHFRQEVELGDEVNYRRVCYWFAGVSVKAVAVLMEENKETIYQRRLRLREKIEDSEYIYKDLYLDLLGK